MTLNFPIKIDPIFKVKKNILFNFYKKTYFKKSSFLIKRWKWLYRLNFKKKIFSYILLKEKEIIGNAGKIPFDIANLLSTLILTNPLNTELHKNLKCGVSPCITHPKAINPSYLSRRLDITTGISYVPGTEINFTLLIFFLFKYFKAPETSILLTLG